MSGKSEAEESQARRQARQDLIRQVRSQREQLVKDCEYHMQQSSLHFAKKEHRRRKREEAKTTTVNKPPQRLTVNVIGAFDVPKMDFTGKADPYVVLECGGDSKKTKTKTQTLAPMWRETFVFDVPPGTADTLSVGMFDYDLVPPNENIGHADIPLMVATSSHGRPMIFTVDRESKSVNRKRKGGPAQLVISLMWTDEDPSKAAESEREIDCVTKELWEKQRREGSSWDKFLRRPSLEGLGSLLAGTATPANSTKPGNHTEETEEDKKKGKLALSQLLGVTKLPRRSFDVSELSTATGNVVPAAAARGTRRRSETFDGMPTIIGSPSRGPAPGGLATLQSTGSFEFDDAPVTGPGAGNRSEVEAQDPWGARRPSQDKRRPSQDRRRPSLTDQAAAAGDMIRRVSKGTVGIAVAFTSNLIATAQRKIGDSLSSLWVPDDEWDLRPDDDASAAGREQERKPRPRSGRIAPS